MSMDANFHSVIDRILSVDHLRLHAAASAWEGLADAGTAEHDRLAAAAADVAAEPGEGLAELGDRIRGAAGWAGDAGAMAARVAGQLTTAAGAAARATERAIDLRARYDQVAESGDDAEGSVGERMRRMSERAVLTAEAVTVLQQLDADIGRVTGDTAPPAPESGGHLLVSEERSVDRTTDRATTGDARTADRATADHAATRRDADRQPADRAAEREPDRAPEKEPGLVPGQPAPDGFAHVLTPDRLSVLGPEGGEFEGWVRSPGTGHLVDPATGREFDPVTSRWVDPVTGLPFGEPATTTRPFAGIGVGPGALAAGVGLGLAGLGRALPGLGRLGGLY
ncbi:hypothetical protein E1265_36005, partial [Streptomyces sp. 8K308]|uniref:hypothetical protein n=1 Tax=Streptomyces sp. 8K308 TaxID=2530388 RepID=UPI0010DA9526